MILLVLGLALPITASYIIAAVITAPALVKLGVPDYAAHMFIFSCWRRAFCSSTPRRICCASWPWRSWPPW